MGEMFIGCLSDIDPHLSCIVHINHSVGDIDPHLSCIVHLNHPSWNIVIRHHPFRYMSTVCIYPSLRKTSPRNIVIRHHPFRYMSTVRIYPSLRNTGPRTEHDKFTWGSFANDTLLMLSKVKKI